LIATIRRNSYVASQEANKRYNSATKQAASAQESLSNQLLDSWSDSQIKEWLDKNGIPVPQGSKTNELVALARKHSARLSGNNVKDQAASAYGAATSSAGYYAQATDDSYAGLRYYYDYALNQIGFASQEAKASLSSASVRASSSAVSASSVASASAVSASSYASSLASVASKSASSASSSASKAGQNAPAAASKAASEVSASASASASSASSVASVSASSSASSASSVASASASSASARGKQEL
jgi:hypothetical protein